MTFIKYSSLNLLLNGSGPMWLSMLLISNDFVSSKSSLELGASILGKGGRLVTLGGSGEQFLANSADMLVKELEFIGSRYCTKQELKESLDLYARGLIKPLVSHKTDFNGAEELHNKIETGDITGRAGILI